MSCLAGINAVISSLILPTSSLNTEDVREGGGRSQKFPRPCMAIITIKWNVHIIVPKCSEIISSGI